jgi:hypothetical protein
MTSSTQQPKKKHKKQNTCWTTYLPSTDLHECVAIILASKLELTRQTYVLLNLSFSCLSRFVLFQFGLLRPAGFLHVFVLFWTIVSDCAVLCAFFFCWFCITQMLGLLCFFFRVSYVCRFFAGAMFDHRRFTDLLEHDFWWTLTLNHSSWIRKMCVCRSKTDSHTSIISLFGCILYQA